ncbi:MAG: tetratricopeptide repeat protein, partial [Spirochaetes bacterium]|nr:tetratricopeptide repeat protein [Spirochaetota bacterium]
MSRKRSLPYLSLMLFILLSCVSYPLPKMVDIKDNLSAEEHNDLGVLYEKQEKYDLAEKEYSKAVKKSKEW